MLILMKLFHTKEYAFPADVKWISVEQILTVNCLLVCTVEKNSLFSF